MEKDNISQLRTGVWMDGFGEDIRAVLERCAELCFRLNSLPPSDRDGRSALVRELFGSIGDGFIIHSPFRCDFGNNIHVGKNFIGNFNLAILDEADVIIGDNVFIGPNTTLCTITHALDAQQRNAGIMRALPISIGDNVWIASNVVVLPGVTIGEGAVIGAGSVVTKDIPPRSLAVGNPCRVLREIGEADKVLI
ncbi:MAG: sugar O-acetyltransferase [Paraprevotella sp.]|nr:sugar O-acetyltransferase [Paraprevotella sp.]